jgi:hypothetical protein
MIKVNLEEIAGFKSAVKAMRNPMNSWWKSDSHLQTVIDDDGHHEEFVLGQEDLNLMQNLFNAGVEHRTYARMIQLWVTIDAPLYWWKEMDRYTVGKTQVSCSTMHKIHAKKFEMSDFSVELIEGVEAHRAMETVINALNRARDGYLSCVDKLKRTDLTEAERKHTISQKNYFFNTMIQILPSSYNQKRTVNLNYEVCMKIWKERHNHKLKEWHILCEFILGLPYMKDIMKNILKDGT